MKRIILTIIMVSVMPMTMYGGNQLTLKVTNIENIQGDLYVALFNSSDTFLGKASIGKVVKVEGNTVEVIFTDLQNDKYAAAIFHDENANGKLDLEQFGIPAEKYGFSNDINPAELKRSPVFEECMFEVNGNTDISVNLHSAVSR